MSVFQLVYHKSLVYISSDALREAIPQTNEFPQITRERKLKVPNSVAFKFFFFHQEKVLIHYQRQAPQAGCWQGASPPRAAGPRNGHLRLGAGRLNQGQTRCRFFSSYHEFLTQEHRPDPGPQPWVHRSQGPTLALAMTPVLEEWSRVSTATLTLEPKPPTSCR